MPDDLKPYDINQPFERFRFLGSVVNEQVVTIEPGSTLARSVATPWIEMRAVRSLDPEKFVNDKLIPNTGQTSARDLGMRVSPPPNWER